jgi:hypothetical protein
VAALDTNQETDNASGQAESSRDPDERPHRRYQLAS